MVGCGAGSTLRGRLFRLSPAKWFGSEISLQEFLEKDVKSSRLVILGEVHGAAPIVGLQTQIQESMAASGATTRVVLEHFSWEMQGLLDRYQLPNYHHHHHAGVTLGSPLDHRGLMEEYRRMGTEGHDLVPYVPALESARNSGGRIRVIGGILPRTFARMVMGEGPDVALSAAIQEGYVSPNETLQGTDAHYNFFESLLTGRSMHGDGVDVPPDQRFRRMFPAQILKDASMAYKVTQLLSHAATDTGTGTATAIPPKVLVVCGLGHMLYNHGVPERIEHPLSFGFFGNNGDGDNHETDTVSSPKTPTLRVVCLPVDDEETTATSTTTMVDLLLEVYGGPEGNAADVCFVYSTKDEEEDLEDSVVDDTDRETREAYDRVGQTAHLGLSTSASKLDDKNNNNSSSKKSTSLKTRLIKAFHVMRAMGYTVDEIKAVGDQAVNFQGVRCPHRHLSLKKGERVLDLGSGLGVDSTVAAVTVGPTGSVVGLERSKPCVEHARRLNRLSQLRFVQGSLERASTYVLSDHDGDHTDTVTTTTTTNHPQDRNIHSDQEKDDALFDAIMSNGAFCLVPDRAAAFRQCYQLLKPGGRIAVATTVLRPGRSLDEYDDVNDNHEHKQWPACLRTFARMDDLEPLLREAGFKDVTIDDTDGAMEMEIPGLVVEDEEEGTETPQTNNEPPHNGSVNANNDTKEEEGRYQVHKERSSEEYRHLENVDMNHLCVRVVITAKKPMSRSA